MTTLGAAHFAAAVAALALGLVVLIEAKGTLTHRLIGCGYVAAMLQVPGFKIHWVSEKPVFSPDGRMAYMRGVDEMTVPGPDGNLTTVHMRGISVWRRDVDGEWRCVVDIANEPPAAAHSS